jgi:general secretion pathway protein K
MRVGGARGVGTIRARVLTGSRSMSTREVVGFRAAGKRASAVAVARDRRGVALMLALWVLLVLGVASLQVLGEVRARVAVASLARSRTVARYAAESGVLAAQTLLDEMIRSAEPAEQALVFEEFRRTVEAWGERPIGDGRYQVVVEDLGSRVDLNRSRVQVVQGLLRQSVSDAEAAELVRALRGWAEEDEEESPGEAGGAAGPDQDLDPSFDELDLSGRPLMHLEELLRVPGFTDSLAAAIAPYVTVWGEGRINVNTAGVRVLASVPGVGDVAAQSLVAAREQEGALASGVAVYSRLSELSGGTASSRMPDLVTVPRRVLIVSRGWEEGRPYTHEVEAVFDVIASRLVTASTVRPRFWTEQGR